MNENTRINLLGKLSNSEAILKLLRHKKQGMVFESIKPEQKDAYLKEGWKINREFKNTIRVEKAKDFDVAFEDEVWSLLALMGYEFLNTDRHFKLPYDKNNPNHSKQIDVFAKD